jgi:hypothetical protein
MSVHDTAPAIPFYWPRQSNLGCHSFMLVCVLRLPDWIKASSPKATSLIEDGKCDGWRQEEAKRLLARFIRFQSSSFAASLNPRRARPPATIRAIQLNDFGTDQSPIMSGQSAKIRTRWNSATRVKIIPATTANVLWVMGRSFQPDLNGPFNACVYRKIRFYNIGDEGRQG